MKTPERGWMSYSGTRPCPRCRKRSYPTEESALAAARSLYPGDRNLTAYECKGGVGFHFGHRVAWPEWFDADRNITCARCPHVIAVDEAAAWLAGPDVTVCLDCATLVERAYLAGQG